MNTTETGQPLGLGLGEGLGPVTERYIERAWLETTDSHILSKGAALAFAKRLLQPIEADVANLRAALHWYAEGKHFDKADPNAWDTVSGEPNNWWCDEAGTAMVEDGSLAGMVLAGKLTGAQLCALEDGEVLKA